MTTEPTRPDSAGVNKNIALHEEQNLVAFKRDLTELVNRYSLENGSDTPDFVLADYLVACLDAWNLSTVQRDRWYASTREQREAVT